MRPRTTTWITVLAATVAVATACGGGDDGDPSTPDAPSVDAVSSPTSENPIALTGTGLAGATVQVRGGAEALVESEVADDGSFSVDVPLREDAVNTLLVSQKLGDGPEGTATTVEVEHDGTAPDTPRVDPVGSPTRRSMVTLRGDAEAQARIRVTGGAEDADGTVDADGRFELTVILETATASVTENDLSVVAIDAAGNESEPASVTVVHNPTLPLDTPALDETPAFTNETTITVSGTADPEVAITVTGGASPADGEADLEGAFSVDVDLSMNSENVLSVFAVNPLTGMSSAPATAIVVHDDVAPEAPGVDPIASPTGASMVHVRGLTEPGAGIDVTGGAADASGTADADGVFDLEVGLTADSTNDLSVTATDRAGNVGDATMVTVEQDSSLPVPVSVDPVSSPTSDNPITLTGSTEASSDVEITGGATPVSVTSAGDGSFSASVTLNANERNELHVSRVGSGTETIVVVTHDDVAPDAPDLDALPSPTNRTGVEVSGSSEPGARISVSGATSTATGRADGTGRFSIGVTIEEDATTTLSVIATDRAGNSSSPATVEITHSSSVPDAPVLDDPSPAPTSATLHTVTGHVTAPGAGITVRISGGASEATGDTDEATGAFSVDVELNANATNELQVVSVEGAIESPPSIVTITHDDVAPDAPDGAAISLGSPSLSTCLARTESINVTGGAGAVEGLARVRVRNLTASSSVAVDANADGSFSTSIRSCSGDRLSLTATDAAGNESAATELTVE